MAAVVHPTSEQFLAGFGEWLREDSERPAGSAELPELDAALASLYGRAEALGGDLRDPTPSLVRWALEGGEDPDLDMETMRFYLLFLRADGLWRRSERCVHGCWDAVDDYGRAVDGVSFAPYDEVVAEALAQHTPGDEVTARSAHRRFVTAIHAIVDRASDGPDRSTAAQLLGLPADNAVVRAWWQALRHQDLVDTEGDRFAIDRWLGADDRQRGVVIGQITGRLIASLVEDLLDDAEVADPEIVATVLMTTLLNSCFWTEGLTSALAAEATVGAMARPRGDLDRAIAHALGLLDDLTAIGLLDLEGDCHRSPDELDPSFIGGLVDGFGWVPPAGDPASFTWEPVELPSLVPEGTTLTVWFGLREFEDEIWRRITVPAAAPLHVLHLAIQRSFGWADREPHAFLDADGAPRFAAWPELSSFDGRGDEQVTDSASLPVGAVLCAPGQELGYRYHRGWFVSLRCEALEQTGATATDRLLPLCGDGTGPFEEAGAEATDLVPSFVPALVVLLLAAENAKATALTQAEVEAIRNDATVIMVPRSVEDAMAASRGYHDLDPEQVWPAWLAAREELAADRRGPGSEQG